MNLRKLILTNNACYKAGKTIKPKGIMVHSTGANNPWLKRYVGPDDGLLGKKQYNNHWNQDKPDGRQVCVHAFIGKLANGSIATYQTLPWNHRGWHGGGIPGREHTGARRGELPRVAGKTVGGRRQPPVVGGSAAAQPVAFAGGARPRARDRRATRSRQPPVGQIG